MNIVKLQRMLDTDTIHEGDVVSFMSKGFIGWAISIFAGGRSHVGQIFKRDGAWQLYEYGFEMGRAGGAVVTPLVDRLAGETARVWVHTWTRPFDSIELLAARKVWQDDIDAAVPYSIEMLIQFSHWLTAVEFWRNGAGRFIPFGGYRLKSLLANPPHPLLHAEAEVCSTEVAHACKAAGRFDGNPDSETPLMVTQWEGFNPEVELT